MVKILDHVDEDSTCTPYLAAYFLYKEIFVNYRVPYELLSDNSPNLLAGVVQHYICILQT